MLVANLDYSDYLGRIAFGKILSGKIRVGDPVVCIHGDGSREKSKITAISHHEGLKRIKIEEVHAGDIVGLTGLDEVFIGETLTDREDGEALPFVPIDPPTITPIWVIALGRTTTAIADTRAIVALVPSGHRLTPIDHTARATTATAATFRPCNQVEPSTAAKAPIK